MLIKPKLVGTHELSDAELKQDSKKCLKIGPCGVGDKALYLNSFFIDRRYYVKYEDISRVWKRVAMSKGGFNGKGAFASMAYLVVKLKNGTELNCNFKYEQNVDILLANIEKYHSKIPTISKEAEKKLKEAELEEQKKYVKNLSENAKNSIESLKEWNAILKIKPAIYSNLAACAKQKRIIDGIDPTYKFVAASILLLAVASAIFGFYLLSKNSGFSMYFVLFGIAFIFTIMATGVLPTRKRNKRTANEDWQNALLASKKYISEINDFPIPPQYAHPVVIDRIIRAIKMGRSEDIDGAFEVVKSDLKALNSEVFVSQKEYDEVVLIKPLFLVMDYK